MWGVILTIAILVLILAIIGKLVFMEVIENEHTFFWMSLVFLIVYILIAFLIARLIPIHLGPANISTLFHLITPTVTSTR